MTGRAISLTFQAIPIVLAIQPEEGGGIRLPCKGPLTVPSTWDWQSKYRVWDASRKIFVYPENWIEPEERVSSWLQVGGRLRDPLVSSACSRASLV